MDWRYVARLLVAVRREKRLRQSDVARLAGVSQTVISRAERGRVDGMTLGVLDRIADALEVDIRLEARWRGGVGDRLIDREHAGLVEQVVKVLRREGWDVRVEFTFNRYGERGAVDVLAYHASARVLLIIEVKSRLTDLQGFLASFGRKVRIVPDLARQELGWDATAVGRLLVVTGSSYNRTLVDRHRAIFDVSFEGRAGDVRRWLRSPSGPLSAIWFISSDATRRSARSQRVRLHGDDRSTR
jgi:transcriptional regulator with XRE-family HTH domain